jgi:Chain length determinant protein
MIPEEMDPVKNKESISPFFNKNFEKMVKNLRRFWWLFLIVALFAGSAGIYYSSIQKTKYKSHLTFALDDQNGNGIGNFLSLASQLGFNLNEGSGVFSGDNIINIMRSRHIVEKVLLSVDTFNHKPYTLIEYFLDKTGRRRNNSTLKKVHFPVNMDRSKFTYSQDSILYKLYQEFDNNYILAQRPDRKLSIYEVSVTSPDEKFTKDFTDKLVDETNGFYIQIRTKKARETMDILEQRVDSMKGNLNSSIAKRSEVQDVNVNPAFAAAEVPVLKQQTNIQVYGSAYGEMFKNLELARFNYLNEIPLMQIIDQANYPMERIKLGKLKAAVLFILFAELLTLSILSLIKLFS